MPFASGNPLLSYLITATNYSQHLAAITKKLNECTALADTSQDNNIASTHQPIFVLQHHCHKLQWAPCHAQQKIKQMKQCWLQPAERMPPQPVNPPLPFHITATNYSKHLTMLTESIEQMKQSWLLLAKMMTMP